MSDTPEWINKYGDNDIDNKECWFLPGVIEPSAESSSGCYNCYPVLEVAAEHRAIIAAAIAKAKEDRAMSDTKQCPQCSAKMIQWSMSVVLPSYPPQTPWVWRCDCGHTETGGVWRGQTQEEIFHNEWQQQQNS